VGAVSAQSDRPAVESKAAFRAGGDADLGSLPASVLCGAAGFLARSSASRGLTPGLGGFVGWDAAGSAGLVKPPTRVRKVRGRSRRGERFEADVGPVAHGGHCIVRLPPPDDRVVFTRHALPGERVVVEITEGADGDRFWRGDAVRILRSAEDRVPAPCASAGPGLCGGCDFQHVSLAAQRRLKAAVVAEQLVRLGGLSSDDPVVADLLVAEVPGAVDGLRWRSRMRWSQTVEGQRGLHAYRSDRVVGIADCLIASQDAGDSAPGSVVVETVYGREFRVASDGFWQAHIGGPEVLVDAVLTLLEPRLGERAWDLYAGVGLFGRFLGEKTAAEVVAVEADPVACRHARANLAPLGNAVVESGRVDRVLAATPGTIDLAVLDPPREGAKRAVVEQIAAKSPRAVAYVACDPAAMSRDLAFFGDHGYSTQQLRAFDLFPMTHHVECVALLTKSGSDLR
jgi:tRNA/tmRNA/rRNA uracil-C5-methylase (TrmA/RlmC/RlmD family)